MKSRFWCFLILLSLLVSIQCKRDEFQKLSKEQIIDRETMIHLMADLEITEAALKLKQTKIKYDSLKKLSNMAFDSLYLYYKTTPEAFRLNLKNYQHDMEDYQEMLEEKINLLTRKNDSITLEPVKIDTTGVDSIVTKERKVVSDSNKSIKTQVKSRPVRK